MGKLRHRTTARLASVLLFATLAAACQDSPTLPTLAQRPTPVAARLNQGQHLGEVPFFCTLGRTAPSSPTGWQTRRLTIFVPRGELDEAGRIVRYEYRRPSSDGRSLVVALCTVPYTEGALRRADRALGVTGDGGAEQFRARQGVATIQGGCVTSPDAVCPVDPIIVIAPPKDRTKEVQCGVMDPDCGSSGGDDSWGDGSWGGGGGGEGGESSDYEEPKLDDNRPDCKKDADGYCITREATEEEWELLRQQIESIREDLLECREAKTILRGFHAQGISGSRFRVWDGKDLNPQRTSQRYGFISSDAGGRIINYDAYHAIRDKGVVVHEALHVYLNNINSPLMGQDNEKWVGQWETTCEN